MGIAPGGNQKLESHKNSQLTIVSRQFKYESLIKLITKSDIHVFVY